MLTKTHQKLCISIASTLTAHNKQPKLHTWRYAFVSSVFSFSVCTFQCACLNSASDNFFRHVLSLETYHVCHVAMTSPFSTTFLLRQTSVFNVHLPENGNISFHEPRFLSTSMSKQFQNSLKSMYLKPKTYYRGGSRMLSSMVLSPHFAL